jgi:hypothetical protein
VAHNLLIILADPEGGIAVRILLAVARDGPFHIEDTAAPIHDRRGHVIGAVIVFHDVSAARAMSLRISYLAQHDFLTELPNRMLLNDRLRQASRPAAHSTEKNRQPGTANSRGADTGG